MAKGKKNDEPTPNSTANRDIIQRLNFLYQASVYLNSFPSSEGSTSTIASTSTTISTNDVPKKAATGRKRKRTKNRMTASDLSKSYIATMKSVGQKTTVKIDPSVKRTICKGCNSIIIPGSTAIVRVTKSAAHGHIMVYTCTGCQTPRRIPAPPNLEQCNSAIDATQSASVIQVAISEAMNIGDSMEVDSAQEVKNKPTLSRRKKLQARIPPLFSRNVGHVVFCGNERLVDKGNGDGVFIT